MKTWHPRIRRLPHWMGKTDWTKKATVILSGASLLAFIGSATTNYFLIRNQQKWRETIDTTNQQLLRKQQEWQEKTRRGEIAPDIQLTQETVFDSTFDEATVVFENIGKNVAKNIFVWIRYNNKIMKITRQDFMPVNGGPEQNYIHPGQKLKFSFGPAELLGKEYDRKSVQEKFKIASDFWTFYFSYFDIDGNEYLLSIREPPTAIRGGLLVNVTKEGQYLDSILLLLPNPRWAKVLTPDPKLRNEYGFVRKDLRLTFDSLTKALSKSK